MRYFSARYIAFTSPFLGIERELKICAPPEAVFYGEEKTSLHQALHFTTRAAAANTKYTQICN
jgi:hypothetical protein